MKIFSTALVSSILWIADAEGNLRQRDLNACPSSVSSIPGCSTNSVYWDNGGGPNSEWINKENWASCLPGVTKYNRVIMAVNDAATVHCPATYAEGGFGFELEMRSRATLDATSNLSIGGQLVMKTNAVLTQSSSSSISVGGRLYLAAKYHMHDQAQLTVESYAYVPTNGELVIHDSAQLSCSSTDAFNSQFHGLLRFVFSTTGTGLLTIDGNLILGDYAKLEIDATSYDTSSGPSRIQLIKYTSATGSFGAGNINIIDDVASGGGAQVTSEIDGVYLELSQGNGQTPITVAPSTAPVTPAPTVSPTKSPSTAPVTPAPTVSPTKSPTEAPVTPPPTGSPTKLPTEAPVTAATSAPTVSPTKSPSAAPTLSTPPPTVSTPPPSVAVATPTLSSPYMILDIGVGSTCPLAVMDTVNVPEEECLAAAQEVADLPNSALNVNTWNGLPCGCFLWHTSNGSVLVDYNRATSGCGHIPGVTQMICKKATTLPTVSPSKSSSTAPVTPPPTVSPTKSPSAAPIAPTASTFTTVVLLGVSGLASISPAVNCPGQVTTDLLIDGVNYQGGAGSISLYLCASGIGFDPMNIRLVGFSSGLWFELETNGSSVDLIIKQLDDYSEYSIGHRYKGDYPFQHTSQDHYPEFSWDTVPRWINFRKNTPFKPEEIESIATNNHLSWYGLYSKEKILAMSQSIKSYNPNYKLILYWNSYGYWGEEIPSFDEAWLKHTIGADGERIYELDQSGNRRLYNHSIPEMREWWINYALDMNAESLVDGIFADATRSPEDTLHSEMIKQLAEALPTGSLKMGNFLRERDYNGNRWRLDYQDGSYMENVHIGPVWQAEHEAIVVSMQLAREALWKRKLIMWNGSPMNCAPPCAVTQEEMSEYIKPTLAEYLVIAEEYAYYSFNLSPNADLDRWKWDTSGMDEFHRPLGQPLGPPVRVGDSFSRHFEHVSVVLDVSTSDAVFHWA